MRKVSCREVLKRSSPPAASLSESKVRRNYVYLPIFYMIKMLLLFFFFKNSSADFFLQRSVMFLSCDCYRLLDEN